MLVHPKWLSQIGAGRRWQLCPTACHPGRAQPQPALTPPSRYVTCIKPLVQWLRRLAQGPLVSKWQSRDRDVGSQVQTLSGDHCTIPLPNDPINQGGKPQVLPRGFANPETQTSPPDPGEVGLTISTQETYKCHLRGPVAGPAPPGHVTDITR